MEKKNSMFKAIMVLIAVTLLFTWILPVSSFSNGAVTKGDITPVALMDVFTSFVNTALPYMGYYAIYILCVGGFYGVLKKSKAYQTAIEKVGEKFKGKESRFLVSSIIFFALMSSLTGMHVELFAFLPLFISIILFLGYDKMTAALSTIGGILVGIIGATYSNYIVGNINSILSTSSAIDFQTELLAKIFLLALCIFLLIMFVYKTAKLATKKAEKEEDKFYEKEGEKKKNATVFWVIMAIIFVLLIIMIVPWRTLFDTKVFSDFHTDIMDVKLGDFAIFKNIFGSLPAFGTWTMYYLPIVFILASIVVAFVYKVRTNDAIDSFFEGAKKVAMPAFLLVLANMVMILVNSSSQNSINTIIVTIVNALITLGNGFNLFLSSLGTMVATVFTPDMQYLSNWYIPIFSGLTGDVTVYPLIALMVQSIYGLMMFVVPVSSILILGLSYLDIKYLDWLKHIWKLLLELLIVILAVLLIVWLI